MAARRFPLVDGLRGIAALSVLLYHAVHKAFLTETGPDLARAFTQHLDVGVSLFFLISGFLLYRPFVAARLAGEDAPDRHSYARRRFWRIVPAYWTVLVLAGLVGLSYPQYPEIFSGQGIPAYFGFLQIYNANTAAGGINTAWTLCVEVTFYVLLPVWAFCIRRAFRRPGVRSEYLALGVLALCSIAWQVFAVHRADPNDFGLAAAPWIEPLPNFIDQFVLGMALAVASVGWERRGPGRAWRGLGSRTWIPVSAALGAYCVMAFGIGLDGSTSETLSPGQYLAVHGLKSVVALGILLPAVLPGLGGSVRRVVGSRPLLFAGKVSYGIYLVQVPVMLALLELGLTRGEPGPQAVWVVAALSATVACAWVLHHLVEAPAMRLGRRPTRTVPRPVPEPASAPAA